MLIVFGLHSEKEIIMKYNVQFLEKFRSNRNIINSFPPEGKYTYTIKDAYFKENQITSKGEQADILYLDLLINDISNNLYIIQAKYYDFLNLYSNRFYQFLDDLEIAYQNNDELYSKIFPNENYLEEKALINTTGALTVIHKEYNNKTYANIDMLIPNGNLSDL